jgi:hypothetical protein
LERQQERAFSDALARERQIMDQSPFVIERSRPNEMVGDVASSLVESGAIAGKAPERPRRPLYVL